MALVNDLVSVENFVKVAFPTARTEKQTVPLSPVANTFVIRFQNDDRALETAAHYRIDREFQLVYFGANAPDVLTKMDAISSALYQTQLIPISGSLRYLRVESFSFSQPFQTDNDLYACIGVLSTEVREARDQPTYDKIMRVTFSFAPDRSTWDVIEGAGPSTEGYTWDDIEQGKFLFDKE